jgi:hypothetical protein
MAGAVLVVFASLPAARGETPACSRDAAGQLSVQAGVRCECVAVAGGSITGVASGYRWDCGILRSRMNQLVPATPNAYQGALPEAVDIDPAVVPLEPRKPWDFPRHPGVQKGTPYGRHR